MKLQSIAQQAKD
jgi:RNA-directed DNA polymerase